MENAGDKQDNLDYTGQIGQNAYRALLFAWRHNDARDWNSNLHCNAIVLRHLPFLTAMTLCFRTDAEPLRFGAGSISDGNIRTDCFKSPLPIPTVMQSCWCLSDHSWHYQAVEI